MNEFRLLSWPELEHASLRTAHCRVLHAMSQRHASVDELAQASGLARPMVRRFIRELDHRGLLHKRRRGGHPLAWMSPMRRRSPAAELQLISVGGALHHP